MGEVKAVGSKRKKVQLKWAAPSLQLVILPLLPVSRLLTITCFFLSLLPIIDTTVIFCAINTTSQALNCVACSTSYMSTRGGLKCFKARSIALRFLQPRFRAITVYSCIDEGIGNVSRWDSFRTSRRRGGVFMSWRHQRRWVADGRRRHFLPSSTLTTGLTGLHQGDHAPTPTHLGHSHSTPSAPIISHLPAPLPFAFRVTLRTDASSLE